MITTLTVILAVAAGQAVLLERLKGKSSAGMTAAREEIVRKHQKPAVSGEWLEPGLGPLALRLPFLAGKRCAIASR